MKIIGAVWAPTSNRMAIECDCGRKFWHPANRWIATCPSCGLRCHKEKLVLASQFFRIEFIGVDKPT